MSELFNDIVPIEITDEMKKSYLDYAMSVIVSRALPDVRDGLKPVHRRILYAMHQAGYTHDKPHRKSARIVGDVIGKFHPHGDSAVYDSLVRMAQDFSLRVKLIDGQGNFGSIDGDAPAAMRYTESRLSKISDYLLSDIEKDTVSFQPNYDGSEEEPEVLPSSFPNLLVNGSGGIAVGMATNIPPHNLTEVIDAALYLIDNKDAEVEDLLEIVKGPDFPTGGTIMGIAGIYSAYKKGKGSVIIRGKTNFEDIDKREAIIITEIPYMVNKARLVEKIAELVKEKRIEGIHDLRDESDKSGIRVVIELKKEAQKEVILNQLYAFTPLQTSFGINMLAIDSGVPKVMTLKEVLIAFNTFREEVVIKRTIYLLNKARDQIHVLIGLLVAVNNIDEVIALIKSSKDTLDAREKLMSIGFDVSGIVDLILSSDDRALVKDNVCYLTETQARAILDMRLARLTALEKDKLVDEVNKIAATIKDLFEILSSRERLISIIKEELIYIRNTFGKERLTEIDSSSLEHDIEDLIKREDMVVTVTLSGYIKRVPLSSYKSQKRGGKGRLGLAMNDNDVTTQIFVANTLTPMLFFSSKGIVYSMKLYKLPVGNPQTKGRPIINLLKLEEGETITKIIALPEDKEELADLQILFITSSGLIRKNSMDDFKKIQSNGKIAFRLEEEGVSLVSVNLCKKDDHILIATKLGKCIRFSVDKIRVFKSRTSEGVRAIKLQEGDQVISAAVINSAEFDMELRAKYLSIPRDVRKNIAKTNEAQEGFSEIPTDALINLANKEQFILTVTENGFGKRTSSYEYRVTGRSGSGIVNMITSERNGSIIASLPVSDYDQVMFITNEGKLIRCPVDAIRITGRVAKGVCVFKLNELEKIVSVALIAKDEDEDELTEEELKEQNALLLQASGIIANTSEDDSIIMEEIEEIEDELTDDDDFDEE